MLSVYMNSGANSFFGEKDRGWRSGLWLALIMVVQDQPRTLSMASRENFLYYTEQLERESLER